MLELPQPGITKSRTAEAGTNSKRSRRGKPSRISPVISRAIVRSSQSEMLFLDRLCFRWREHVCVEQVLAAPACYFAVLAARKKLMCRRLILLVSWEKRNATPSLSRVMHASSIAGLVSSVHFCSLTRYRVVTALPPALQRRRVAKRPKAGRCRLLTAKCQAARLSRPSRRPKLWGRMGHAFVARVPLNSY